MALHQLPKQWWNFVLDGGIYRINLQATQFKNMTALRSACYREAELRSCLAATHKQGVEHLLVQAWGRMDLGVMSLPVLANAVWEEAPVVAGVAPPPPPRVRTHDCDCGQGPITHPLTCSLWAGKAPTPTSAPAPWSRPAPQEQPPTPDDQLTEADIEALLGPCTCGQAPTCLPSCARAGG